MLKKKGYSPHWMWFGVLPFVGWIVVVVAFHLTASSQKSLGMTPPFDDYGQSKLEQYHNGMRSLGTGLIVLSVFSALASAAFLTGSPSKVPGLFVGMMAVLHLVLGLFALKLQAWVNYVVAALVIVYVVAALVIVDLPLHLFIISPSGRYLSIIAPVFFSLSVNNLQTLRSVRADSASR